MENPLKKIPIFKRILENNRIGRLDYFIMGLISSLIIIGFISILGLSNYKTYQCKTKIVYREYSIDKNYKQTEELNNELKNCEKNNNILIRFFLPFFIILMIILIYLNILSIIKRYHDLNKSGWNILWNFIPYVNIIFLYTYNLQLEQNEKIIIDILQKIY